MLDMPKIFDTNYVIHLSFEEVTANGNVTVKIKDNARDWAKREFRAFYKEDEP